MCGQLCTKNYFTTTQHYGDCHEYESKTNHIPLPSQDGQTSIIPCEISQVESTCSLLSLYHYNHLFTAKLKAPVSKYALCVLSQPIKKKKAFILTCGAVCSVSVHHHHHLSLNREKLGHHR